MSKFLQLRNSNFAMSSYHLRVSFSKKCFLAFQFVRVHAQIKPVIFYFSIYNVQSIYHVVPCITSGSSCTLMFFAIPSAFHKDFVFPGLISFLTLCLSFVVQNVTSLIQDKIARYSDYLRKIVSENLTSVVYSCHDLNNRPSTYR